MFGSKTTTLSPDKGAKLEGSRTVVKSWDARMVVIFDKSRYLYIRISTELNSAQFNSYLVRVSA